MEDTNPGGFTLQPVQKRDHRKFDKEKPKPFLDMNDFTAAMDELIEGDRPEIVDNLVEHLTGVQLHPVKQSIREEDEFAFKTPIMPDKNNDEELGNYFKVNKLQFTAIHNAFKHLWGETKEL